MAYPTTSTGKGFWFRLTVLFLKPPLTMFTKRDWQAGEHLPTTGGVIIAANHTSYFDPLAVAHFLYAHGRFPRFLAKAGLFANPLLGRVLRGAGQIPVYRHTSDAAGSLRDAAVAVRRGECVVFYPEGTVTRDPALWPMTGKTGVARLALSTGAPVIPLAQWGAQRVIPSGSFVPRLFPRKTMRIIAGPPVDLSAFSGQQITRDLLCAATAVIMAEITTLLEKLRGEPASGKRIAAGNPDNENDPRQRQGSPR